MKLIKKNLLLTVVIVLLLIGGAFAVASNYQNKPATKTTSSQTKKTVVTLEISADGKTKHYDLTNGVGQTALAATQSATGNVTMTGTGANAFITAINGRTADTGKREFWKLVINGQDSQVGAGSYTVKENDALVWKIDTY